MIRISCEFFRYCCHLSDMCRYFVTVGLLLLCLTMIHSKCYGDLCEEPNPKRLPKKLHKMLTKNLRSHLINTTGTVFEPFEKDRINVSLRSSNAGIDLCLTREITVMPTNTADKKLSIVNIKDVFEQRVQLITCEEDMSVNGKIKSDKTQHGSMCKKLERSSNIKTLSCVQKFSNVRFLCVDDQQRFSLQSIKVPYGCSCMQQKKVPRKIYS